MGVPYLMWQILFPSSFDVIARLNEQFPEMSWEKIQKRAKNVGMKVHLNGSAPARALLHWVW